MVNDYNRETLRQENHKFFPNGQNKRGREWNQYVSGAIANQLLDKLDGYTFTQLKDFLAVLPLITVGAFWTAAQLVKSLVIDDEKLKDVQAWLTNILLTSDDEIQYKKECEDGN